MAYKIKYKGYLIETDYLTNDTWGWTFLTDIYKLPDTKRMLNIPFIIDRNRKRCNDCARRIIDRLINEAGI